MSTFCRVSSFCSWRRSVLFGVFAFCSLAINHTTLADESRAIDLTAFGLEEIKPLSQLEGDAVRGSALETRHFGISFISGMLFDPSTSSFIKGHSIQLTQGEDFVAESHLLRPNAESMVTWDREVELEIGTEIVDLNAFMRGLVQATGFSLSQY